MITNGDIDFEIKFYEGLLEKKGDFIQALIAIGNLYTQKGMYQKGLEVDEKLAQLRPDDPIIFYNLACSYSLLKKIEESFLSIKKAVSLGYDDFIHLEQDKDLLNLLKEKRFKAYLSTLKKNTITKK